ncbi:histone acetyltransferase GCN5 [Acrodontium crateriforme]|uniref:histone acetyltransferase n=1 Tax=Acrodontium crateriforme TaxID=150365 RepID=A0AAQ3R9N8_9PEZI|nr:histone acetyltransferase GCN5 [Acrodontium crateriforme]
MAQSIIKEEIKRKAADDLNGAADDEPDAKRLKPSVSPTPEQAPETNGHKLENDDRLHDADVEKRTDSPPAPPPAVPFPEKPAVIEERNGDISFQVVNNDGKPRSMIIMTGLKCIFQKQLPKMPKDYIARLVYDRTHMSLAIVKRPPAGSHAEASGLPGEVVGGITYRPFKGRQFAEIVFCAISSDQQVKGYGAHMMSHLKDFVKATSDVMYFLTYADNYAIGYFKKQGFTKEITLDRPKWMGYIKDYEGGTIMQCSMLPKIRYLESGRLLLKQKATVHAKIRAVSKSYEVHQPPAEWKNAKKGSLPEIDPLNIPAIKATGWSPDMDALARQPRRNPSHSLLLALLSALQTSSSAWPFLQPVNGDEVHDYYDVITEPMDLSTMESKLEKDQYENVEDFIKDLLLLVRNCKRYNAENTPYAKAANKLEKEMWKKIREVPEWSYLEPENFETTNRKTE